MQMADPPPGEIRDLENVPFSGTAMNVTGTVTCTLACIVVALRVYAKVGITKRKLGIDDCKTSLSIPYNG